MSTTLQPSESREQVALKEVESTSADRAAEQMVNGLRVAAWLGLIVGLFEAGVQLFQGLRGTFIGMDPQFVWMAPLAECVVFAVIAVPLLVLVRRVPNNVGTIAVTGFLVFLGVYSIATLIGGLLWWAILIISTGVAVQATRVVKAHTERFHWITQKTLPCMLALVILGGVLMTGHRWNQEAAAVAALPPVSPLTTDQSPNVLVVVLDTVRADALSVYSDKAVPTPNLEELAASGVTFQFALSPASWTYPSHASMFTGEYANRLSADWFTPLDDKHPLLAEALARQGYENGGFVANTMYCSRVTGLGRGFTRYEDYPVSLSQLLTHSRLLVNLRESHQGLSQLGLYDRPGRKKGKQITSGFVNWLDQRSQDRPFFAFLNYMDAHDPYLPERLIHEDRKLTHEEKVLMKNWRWVVPSRTEDDLWQLAKSSYESMLCSLDDQIGKLMKELEQRGLRENTIVVITSDHGELFGEHGTVGHGNNLYRPVVHVPLIVSWPKGMPAGERVSVPVTLRDLSATVLDLTGVDAHEQLPGHSLRVTWESATEASEPTISLPYAMSSVHPAVKRWAMFTESPSIHGDLHSLLLDNSYLIQQGDGQQLLYDFVDDPDEKNDLAQEPASADRVRRVSDVLKELLD